MNRFGPIKELFLARVREFFREPEALFWVYGFPLLLAIGLGLAFSRKEPEAPIVDVVQSEPAAPEVIYLAERLADDGIKVEQHSASDCLQRYRVGKTMLYVEQAGDGYRFHYDPAREESVLARHRVEGVIHRIRTHTELKAGPESASDKPNEKTRLWSSGEAAWRSTEIYTTDPGNRYIDFLLPGLMGMNLMGGGLWGVGFVIVDMRVRKLLKRLLATPMRHSDFLLSILGERVVFMVPDMMILALVGWFGFGVPMRGNLALLLLVVFIGSAAFSGIGLLIASRAQKTETVSGLMNLVMLPMWLLSGTFFSSKRYPDAMQPFIQALPLTQVNDCLREVMLEGSGLAAIGWRLAILAAWSVITFALALRLFRWN